jgi:hypothetical protein
MTNLQSLTVVGRMTINCLAFNIEYSRVRSSFFAGKIIRQKVVGKYTPSLLALTDQSLIEKYNFVLGD